jgi:hypothetical protein
LQGNPYGTTLLGYNNKGVWMMDDALVFQLIGSVDDFICYCIRCVLDEKDWFRSFYWGGGDKKLLESYNLKMIRPFDEY